MPKKYRKKPVVIEAIQFRDDNEVISRLSDFIGSTIRIDYAVPKAPVFKVETLEGVMTASVGDYIIKGIQGEFYPCKPEIFEATYERYQGVAYQVKVTDTDVFKSVLSRVSDLIEQVELCDFKDENGHELKVNKAYSDLLEAIGLQRVAN